LGCRSSVIAVHMIHVICIVLAIYGEELEANYYSIFLLCCAPADHCLIRCTIWLARVRFRLLNLKHRVNPALAHPSTSQFIWYQHPLFLCSNFPFLLIIFPSSVLPDFPWLLLLASAPFVALYSALLIFSCFDQLVHSFLYSLRFDHRVSL